MLDILNSVTRFLLKKKGVYHSKTNKVAFYN